MRNQSVREVINAGSRSESLRERELSNFSARPFTLRGQQFSCVESFVQAVKYPQDSTERTEISAMTAVKAKRKSPHVPPEFIEWEGRLISYRSHEHYLLHAAGIFAKFDQNEEALELLLATGTLPIIHDLSTPERPWSELANTCLPATVFCQILVETRQFFFSGIGRLNPDLVGDETPMYITEALVAYARSI